MPLDATRAAVGCAVCAIPPHTGMEQDGTESHSATTAKGWTDVPASQGFLRLAARSVS